MNRVLLVDDNPSFLVAMRRIVHRLRPEATVVYAADVAAAQWRLRTTDVCLVFTDMRLPSGDQDGLRVVSAAREAGVPVAVVSGVDGSWRAELAQLNVTVLRKAELTTSAIGGLIERLSLPTPV